MNDLNADVVATCNLIDRLCGEAAMPKLRLPPGYVTVRMYHHCHLWITEYTAAERLKRGVANGALKKIVCGNYRGLPVFAYGPAKTVNR